ncbi:HDOD domain-containing protein [Pelagibaculum spongiae]|uniref:Histidine kinase n=1 Tax=Pelagibaculum spongiae TaxID=2080658 RepID=A0A2V1GW79_9GAMM|nr:HDOD domain-containing protein [Pelagibaculum spongiae]PVZ62968.1 histidine kinase [Pelagibaculum spongiae]
MDKQQIVTELAEKIEKGQLKLPGFPELAMKIRQATNDPDKDVGEISKIIQTDPLLAAYLIKTVNSPIYRGRVPISSCREAVMRLGLKITRNLVVAFTMRHFFQPKADRFKKKMQDLWQHSTRVAALAAVLARNGSRLNPDKAVLAGLLHDIGTIPLLQALSCQKDLQDEELDQIIISLRGQIGQMILKQWELDDDLALVCREADNWSRDHDGELDYVDLVNIAQLHSFIGTPEMVRCPTLDKVPAMGRLGMAELTPESSLLILEQAREEIAEVESLLRN